jgi:hypothetical protein
MSDYGAQEPLGHVEASGRLEPPAGSVSYKTVRLSGQKRRRNDGEGAGPGDLIDFEDFEDVSWSYLPIIARLTLPNRMITQSISTLISPATQNESPLRITSHKKNLLRQAIIHVGSFGLTLSSIIANFLQELLESTC